MWFISTEDFLNILHVIECLSLPGPVLGIKKNALKNRQTATETIKISSHKNVLNDLLILFSLSD